MLNEIKSKYILKRVFAYLKYGLKLKILKHNKNLMNKLNINIKDFQNFQLLKELNQKYNIDIQDIDVEELKLNIKGKINEVIKIITQLKLEELKSLDLAQNGLENIDFLPKFMCKNLEILNLQQNRLKGNLIELEKVDFQKLKKLNLSNNYIKNIDILEKVNFKNLEILDLCLNYIADINVLERVNFTKLKSLNLHKNQITNVDVLKKVNFKNLEELTLSCNKVSYCYILENNNFIKLKILNIAGNKISNISELEKNNYGKLKIILNANELDILYMIDCTGGMYSLIYCIRDTCTEIYDILNKNLILTNYDIKFSGVFYRDPVDSPSDRHEYQPLGDVNDLREKMKTIHSYGGGDYPEDWVGAYKIALDKNRIGWRKNSVKIIIHITDAGAHGREFSDRDRFPAQGVILIDLVKQLAKEKISIFGYQINDLAEKSFEKCKEIYDSVKPKNCTYKINKIDWYSIDKRSIVKDSIIQQILEFIELNN